MGKPLRDLTGQVFGALTALHVGPKTRKTSGAWWQCQCTCGVLKSLPSTDLVAGKIRSCGCMHQELKAICSRTHGQTITKTYRIWLAMKNRCGNAKTSNFNNYGGRGISVCKEWLVYENFVADMGLCNEGLSIERNDVNGNYEPSNCKWASRDEQANNTRSNVFIKHDGKRMTRTQWEKELGLGKTTIRARMRLGWSIEDALTRKASHV
jgi:hypothetical protein